MIIINCVYDIINIFINDLIILQKYLILNHNTLIQFQMPSLQLLQEYYMESM